MPRAPGPSARRRSARRPAASSSLVARQAPRLKRGVRGGDRYGGKCAAADRLPHVVTRATWTFARYNARAAAWLRGEIRCLFVDLFEYQARDLLASHGVPVLPGGVAETPDQAEAIARDIAQPVVVKAQVKVGGRGKAGGVKLADNPEDAKARAQDILGLDIKGHITHRVMVAQSSDIAEEYYFSYLLDRSNRTFLAMASKEGGMEIEQLAVERPEALARIPVDASVGVDTQKAAEIVDAAGFPAEVRDQVIAIAVSLWDVFTKEDATLVEINPLAKAPDGTVLALDAKVTLDDNSSFRHEWAGLEDTSAADPLEARAKEKHLNYVKLEGEVGIIGNGAGLVMSTLDVVAYAGEEFGGVRPANFLDIGGGASAEVMANGLEIILSDPAVK